MRSASERMVIIVVEGEVEMPMTALAVCGIVVPAMSVPANTRTLPVASPEVMSVPAVPKLEPAAPNLTSVILTRRLRYVSRSALSSARVSSMGCLVWPVALTVPYSMPSAP